MALSPAMSAAITAPSLRAFFAVRLELPGYSLNLIDGAGVVTFSVNGASQSFSGQDPLYGVLLSLSALEESFTTESPRISASFSPPTTSAIASMASIQAQGSPVYVWYGLVNEAIGSVIGEPMLLFNGRLDFAKVVTDAGVRFVEVEVASAWDRLFVASEGERLTDAAHQRYWPGETGLAMAVTSALVDPIWGAEAVQATTTPGTPGFEGASYTGFPGISGL